VLLLLASISLFGVQSQEQSCWLRTPNTETKQDGDCFNFYSKKDGERGKWECVCRVRNEDSNVVPLGLELPTFFREKGSKPRSWLRETRKQDDRGQEGGRKRGQNLFLVSRTEKFYSCGKECLRCVLLWVCTLCWPSTLTPHTSLRQIVFGLHTLSVASSEPPCSCDAYQATGRPPRNPSLREAKNSSTSPDRHRPVDRKRSPRVFSLPCRQFAIGRGLELLANRAKRLRDMARRAACESTRSSISSSSPLVLHYFHQTCSPCVALGRFGSVSQVCRLSLDSIFSAVFAFFLNRSYFWMCYSLSKLLFTSPLFFFSVFPALTGSSPLTRLLRFFSFSPLFPAAPPLLLDLFKQSASSVPFWNSPFSCSFFPWLLYLFVFFQAGSRSPLLSHLPHPFFPPFPFCSVFSDSRAFPSPCPHLTQIRSSFPPPVMLVVADEAVFSMSGSDSNAAA
jgi:hypothetical protein